MSVWNPNGRSNSTFLASCLENLEEAKGREEKLVECWENWPIGDPRRNGDKATPSLLERIRSARSDIRHWEREIAYWRGRCVLEGDAALPSGGIPEPRRGTTGPPISEVVRQRMNDPELMTFRRLGPPPGDEGAGGPF